MPPRAGRETPLPIPRSEPTPGANRMPRQIAFIVGNEACERFSYYGMRSILAGYITGKVLEGGLGQEVDTSTSIVHTFVFVNYFMPLFGGWLSDRLIGRYNTILWVSLFYCAGHGTLACSDFVPTVHGKMVCLFVGLALIAFGSGGIKPCVSAFMGDQFKPEQSHLIQMAYGAFYWSINLGSFFSFLVIPWIKDHKINGHYNYSLAFGVPGILMAIATFVFWLGRNYYIRVPASRETKRAGFLAVFFAACAHQTGKTLAASLNMLTTLGLPTVAMIGLVIVAFGDPANSLIHGIGVAALACVAFWYLSVVATAILGKFDLGDVFWQSAGASGYSDVEISAARSVGPILFVFSLIPIFFTLFDQSNSTWVIQGGKMVPFDFHLWLPTFDGFVHWIRHLAGSPFERVLITIDAENMQSANPLMVMILVPLLTILVYPLIGRFAAPLHRMAYGMFFAAFSYIVVALIQARVTADAHISVLWQAVPYFILTTGEVLTSTTGLEFAFRESAPEMKSTIMSFWLVAIAFGDLLVVGITRVFTGPAAGAHAESVSTGRFYVYAGLTFIVAILFSIVASRYDYRDKAAAAGK